MLGTTERKMANSIKEVIAVTLACMVLHNVCLERGETMSKVLNLTTDPVTNQRRDRERIWELLQMTSCGIIRDSGNQASAIREALGETLFAEKESGGLLICLYPVQTTGNINCCWKHLFFFRIFAY